jgi:ADP-heptose:LPS heptosyltransferase
MKMNLQREAIFVGMPKEHEYFEWTFGITIPYHKTETVLELAKVIKGSKLFIGNSSFPLALAIGMGHPNIMQEVDPKAPTTVFQNKQMTYI